MKRLDECVDGEFQTFKSKDGAYVRKHFFGKYPELAAMVSNMSDDDIWRLNRGGHEEQEDRTDGREEAAAETRLNLVQ